MLGVAGGGKSELSRAKTSSTFTNNAPTPSARAPIQSGWAPRPQGAQRTRGGRCAALPRTRTSGIRQPPSPAARTGGSYRLQCGVWSRTPVPPRWGTMARLAAPLHWEILARFLFSTWCLLCFAGQVGHSARLASLPLLGTFF